MKFRRNVFYPVRLILYPICIQILLMFSGITLNSAWVITIDIISTLLLVEAVFEFVMPYAVWHGNEIMIYSSILFYTKIDLSKYTADDIRFEHWFVKIGKQYISLRRFRKGYRERFEEGIEKHFRLDPTPVNS